MTNANGGRPLRPSEVLERIIDDHRKLREKLDALETLAREVLADANRDRARELREAATEVHRWLVRHIDHEDAVLIPAIRDADGYGDARAKELADEHETQRKWLDLVIGPASLKTSTPPLLGDRVLRFIETLRKDMDHEERDFVNDRILRDDIIQLGFVD